VSSFLLDTSAQNRPFSAISGETHLTYVLKNRQKLGKIKAIKLM